MVLVYRKSDSICLGIRVNVEWELIAHSSSFFYGRAGSRQRGIGAAQLSRSLESPEKGKDKSTKRKVKMNTDGPAWPFEIGEALSVNRENGGGLHSFTALHFKPSAEIKDVP